MRYSALITVALFVMYLSPLKVNALEVAQTTKKSPVTMPLTIEIPAPEVIHSVSHPPLNGTVLNLGDNLHLDRPFVAGEQAPEGCVEKPTQNARFCLDPVQWPAALSGRFAGSDVIYKGGQAIIQYDANKAVQAHILFPSAQFIDVVEHLRNRFGTPTEEAFINIPIPDTGPVMNTVVRWHSINSTDKTETILEVRAHDDIRSPFPDADHGFVWLYHKGDQPIFRTISMLDLMVLRKRRIGQWPYGNTSTNKSPVQ